MTMIDGQQEFEQAIGHDDAAFLLIAFLRLIVAADHGIHAQITQLQALEGADNAEYYREIMQFLMTRDILAYTSAASAQEAADLRRLLDVGVPGNIMNWYDPQLVGRVTNAADILASVASALRTVLTIIYGTIDLLRTSSRLTMAQESVCQSIIVIVDRLRACRNQLRERLGAAGIQLPEY